MTAPRHALVVGIDGYPDHPLSGCCEDARGVGRLLRRHDDESLNWAVEEALGRSSRVPVVSSRALVGRLQRHFTYAEDADILFYFSGHATASSLGVELCTQDGVGEFLGVPLATVMNLVQGACLDGARSVTVILDCCFSGAIGTNVIGDDRASMRMSQLPENVVLLTSSKPRQPSSQGVKSSPFTRVLIDGLEGAAADLEGAVTALSLFQFANRAARANGPRPQLRANCDLLPVLRRAHPSVDLDELLSLTDLFRRPEDESPVQSPWEWDGGPVAAGALDSLRRSETLCRLRNAGLIEASTLASLRWLGAHDGTIRLTQRGRYYWRLVKAGGML